MKSITAILFDFANLAQGSDAEIFQRMVFHCRTTNPAMLPRNLKFNAYTVTRKPNLLTIHLLQANEDRSKHREVAQFSFAPPPDFSQRPVML